MDVFQQIPNRALVLDLLDWIGAEPRPYRDVMAAWRTSCPRLPIWEDALELGLVCTQTRKGTLVVEVTSAGLRLLRSARLIKA
jgi:hypothetical protein